MVPPGAPRGACGSSPPCAASSSTVCGAAPSSSWSCPSALPWPWHLTLEVALVGGLRETARGVRHDVARGIGGAGARLRGTLAGGGWVWATGPVATHTRALGRGATHRLLRGGHLHLLLLLQLLH